MAVCVMYRHYQNGRARYYRVELAFDLFDNVSVFCEWGIVGGKASGTHYTFDNLKDASAAADIIRTRTLKRG